ncbi:SGNH/GDSL hydrolase family protein [Novosphingobium sp. CECT 9465]|uniref:SGNH/GDSL hydrolase family protein n=1 Tax=Novosphingobium sp. CECT 9465 TaxID=2829794 RepID=UPI001E600979|nr:SGNH/GDSL hydrolase family protein [Novosphingobium sp. CECT 9465]
MAIALPFVGWQSGERPHWQVGGSQIVGHASLPPAGTFPLIVPKGASLILQGDSNVRSRPPIDDARSLPTLLRRSIGPTVEVVVRSFGGDTISLGMKRWLTGTHPGDLVILVYGTNDAAPRGWMAKRERVPTHVYQMKLAELARKFENIGARTLILAPLPTGSSAMERRVAPYRFAARQAAIDANVSFLDPVAAFNRNGIKKPALGYDGLHLSVSGHEQLSAWLIQNIRIGVRHNDIAVDVSTHDPAD